MRDKTKMIIWYAGLAALAAAVSCAAYRLGHPTIAVLVIIVPVAMIANGFLAEVEDNAPGGFNNPSSNPSDQDPPKNKDNKRND
ncbi:hypothetical protein EG832_02230 [bacterium]|nr:hypothetical protein [bacterium]